MKFRPLTDAPAVLLFGGLLFKSLRIGHESVLFYSCCPLVENDIPAGFSSELLPEGHETFKVAIAGVVNSVNNAISQTIAIIDESDA